MEVMNDDFLDELEDFSDIDEQESKSLDLNNDSEEDNSSSEEYLEDFVTSILKSRGIEDKSKIKFANDEGDIEEVDWNNLSEEDKVNILKSSEKSLEDELDDSEIQLLNAIRTSGLSPAEYLNYIEKESISRYVLNNTLPQFEVDQYSDDELFIMDFISRTGDVTEEEALEALEKAKSNEDLYLKLVNAIRNEYQQAELENLLQSLLELELYAQLRYELFSDLIVDEINNLTEIEGFNLNMNNDDMQMLYDFITGTDAAGNNHMAKALSDPTTLVKTAWLALNGDQMISDITNYFLKEISNVRKESYKRGVLDTQNKMNKHDVIFKDAPRSHLEAFSDLDEF